MSELEINQQTVEQIRAAFANGKGYQKGDWLAVLDGKVIAVAKELDLAVRALRTLDPDPRRGMIFEYGNSDVDVIR